MKIPIYRAKKIDSDEYIQGYFFRRWIDGYILWGTVNDKPEEIRVDTSTLSINFPAMLDSEGNKIFASLSEDGKGGDIFYLGDKRLNYIALIHNNSLMAKQENTYGSLIGQGYAECKLWKVIGIQE